MNMQGHNANYQQPRRHNRMMLALFILLIGCVSLGKAIAFPFLPDWLFTWPMLLVSWGVFIAITRGFRDNSWIVLVLIGGFFLADDIIPGFSLYRFMWPLILIGIGLLILLRPRNKNRSWGGNWSSNASQWHTGKDDVHAAEFSTDDEIDITSVLGGTHRTIVSKDFKGGEITNFMGGTELNLSQADINGRVVIDITQVMGGIKLIVPPHWQLQNDVSSVFAGVDDRRRAAGIADPNKVLVLKGTSVMAGIDIR